MPTSERRIRRVETKFCPLSTDGGGERANHRVKDGACTICDRSVRALEVQHGLA